MGLKKKDIGKSKNKIMKWAKEGTKRVVSCQDPPSGLTSPFSVSQLFYNIVSCRKMIITQMILVHRNADRLCLAGVQLIIACAQCLCLFVSSLPHPFIAYTCVALNSWPFVHLFCSLCKTWEMQKYIRI